MKKSKEKDKDNEKRKPARAGSLRFEDYTAEDAEKEEAEIGSGRYGKIRPGANRLRILPARPGEKWKEVIYKHFVDIVGAGTVSFTCPMMTTKGKRKCKTCAKVKKLQDSKDKRDNAKADRMRAQRKVMFNAVDRKDEDSGPKTYEVGTGIDKDLIEIRKFQGINFQHPTDGCDVIVVKTGTKRNDTRYKTSAARDTTPLHEDEDVMQEWIENQPSLVVKLEDDEDIEAKLRGEDPRERRDRKRGRNRDEDDEEDESLDDDDLDDQDEDDRRSSKKKSKRRDDDDEDEDDEEIELD